MNYLLVLCKESKKNSINEIDLLISLKKFISLQSVYRFMRKKKNSISLLIMVNILLLTFLMTAHHHHQGIPHFTLEEQQEQNEDCDGSSCTHEEDATCLFERNLIAINPIKEDCTCLLCFLHNHPQEFVQALFPYDFSFPEADKSLRQSPYLLTYHSVDANSGPGLRAPPVA
jgi:hypothetical protein